MLVSRAIAFKHRHCTEHHCAPSSSELRETALFKVLQLEEIEDECNEAISDANLQQHLKICR